MDILIIEDDRQLGESLVRGLGEAGLLARHVTTVAAARRAFPGDDFKLVVLDLGLPDGDGMDLLVEWCQSPQHIPMLITTARSQLADRLRGLDAGADDYLVKPYAFSELVARIRVQLRHVRTPEALRFRVGDLELQVRPRVARRGEREIELTPREFDLLAYLMENAGQVVTREMLARDVWHVRSRMTSLDNVIDVHVSRLREKLDRGSTARLLHTVRGVGFVVREEGA